MANYIETQTRKVISSYGGVGSLIETERGALIVLPFDQWKYFDKEKHLNEENIIVDNRLLNRLRYNKGFPKLKNFVKIPINSAHMKYKNFPSSTDNVIDAKYFPEWFYCPRCEHFHKISEWWTKWKIVLKNARVQNETIRKLFYNKPKCFNCYKNTKGKSMIPLEQVRFIMTSQDGIIEDIPWELWNNTEMETDSEKGQRGKLKFNFDLCCDKQDLKYKRSPRFADLAGIWIECTNCKKKQTLRGLFNFFLPVNNIDNSNQKYIKKAVIRSSNSVYYPILINSLFIPTKISVNRDIANEIDAYQKDGLGIDDIVYIFSHRKIPKEAIVDYINSEKKQKFEPEIEFRRKEYNYITTFDNEKNTKENNKSLIIERERTDLLEKYGIKRLIKLKKIKMITVQTAYTRQEPLDKDLFLKGDIRQIKPKYTSKWGNQTEYLPAIESYGEGIFVSLESQKMNKFTDRILRNKKAMRRINTVNDNLKNPNFIPDERFNNIEYLMKFMMIHTLSHILIKELEFSVGYPATSLNERLYIDEDNMSGVLIYTIAGSEGSYGGLINNASQQAFLQILSNALLRASDCSSDPICYNTQDGQGVGGLNLAACYSCALIPDISCEEFNCFLDRWLLIDKEFGFFNLNLS